MAQQLEFQSIEFSGFESLEPAFDPKIRNYTIHRKAGNNFCFRAKLNQKPRSKIDNKGSVYQEYFNDTVDSSDEEEMPSLQEEYANYTLEYLDGDNARKWWSYDCWHRINCVPGEESRFSIICSLPKKYVGPLQELWMNFTVITEEMSEEGRLACTHPSTCTKEGKHN